MVAFLKVNMLTILVLVVLRHFTVLDGSWLQNFLKAVLLGGDSRHLALLSNVYHFLWKSSLLSDTGLSEAFLHTWLESLCWSHVSLSLGHQTSIIILELPFNWLLLILIWNLLSCICIQVEVCHSLTELVEIRTIWLVNVHLCLLRVHLRLNHSLSVVWELVHYLCIWRIVEVLLSWMVNRLLLERLSHCMIILTKNLLIILD